MDKNEYKKKLEEIELEERLKYETEQIRNKYALMKSKKDKEGLKGVAKVAGKGLAATGKGIFSVLEKVTRPPEKGTKKKKIEDAFPSMPKVF